MFKKCIDGIKKLINPSCPTAVREPISQEEYISREYNSCPLCGNKYIRIIDSRGSANQHMQKVRCTECHAIWEEEFHMTDYTLIKRGDQ
jgi:hypothetical protein